MLKGPLQLKPWARFCAHCRHPIAQDEPAFLDEGEEDGIPDSYIHADCITAYVKNIEES